jgi:hypothetical protein
MIWNVFFWLVMLFIWLGALLRRSSLRSCSLLSAEVQGRVWQLDLLNGPGTRCEFVGTSPEGSGVKLHSVVTHPFKIGDAVRVRYNPWRPEAYTGERLGDSNPQVIFDYRSPSRLYRAAPVVDGIIVLFTAIGCIFCAREFSLEALRLKSP